MQVCIVHNIRNINNLADDLMVSLDHNLIRDLYYKMLKKIDGFSEIKNEKLKPIVFFK